MVQKLAGATTRNELEEAVASLLVSVVPIDLLRVGSRVAWTRVDRHLRHGLEPGLRGYRNGGWVV